MFCFIADTNSLFAQNLSQLQKKAESNLKALNYSAAQVDYRQLLAQDPKSIDFNFKYAICVYYSEERNTAKKYFEFAAQSPQAPTSVYYYLGKLNHFEYKFQKAISYYQLYLKNSPEKNREFDAVEEIERCKQGIVLLENPVSLRLLSMKKSSLQNFYLEYVFENRKGRFFTDIAFQSKNDKKNNHVPLYYFARGEQYKIFSSYGSENQKDIYYCKKINADSWSSPIKILGALNTEANEDFPFYDEKNARLYFASDGHNSMGGVDVFKIDFDPIENNSNNCKNLDFPFSSTSDDYLFVPDDTLNQAFFASNRNSSKNQLIVYSVSNTYSSSTIQLIKGVFIDAVNPKNFTAQISVIDQESNITYGPYATNEQGEYNLLLPGGGEFKFIVSVEGSNKQFENVAKVPFIRSKQILKQELYYQIVSADEEVLFKNIFKPYDASEEDQLNVLTAMASFNINPSLKTIREIKPSENNTQNILSSMGISETDETLALDLLQDALIEVELLPEEIHNTILKLATLKQESYQDLKVLQNQIELKVEEVNTVKSDKLVRIAEKELLDLQNELLKKQQFIIAVEELESNYSSQIKKISAVKSIENSARLGDQLKELRFKENKDSLNTFLNLNQQKIKELITLVNPKDTIDYLSLSEEYTDSIKELTKMISEEIQREQNIEEQIILDSKLSKTISKKELLELNVKIEGLKNEQKTIKESIGLNNDALFLIEQKVKVLKIQNEISFNLEKIKVQNDALVLTANKYSKVNFESLLETHENQIKIKETIAKHQLVLDPLIALQYQEDSLQTLVASQNKYNQLLILKGKEEILLKDRLRKAEMENNAGSIEEIQEQLQLLENNKSNIQISLRELDSVPLAMNQTPNPSNTQTNLVTEEQTPNNTQTNKNNEEERLAANPVTEEPTSNNTQINKSSEEERLAANPLTEEPTSNNTQTNKSSEEERLASHPLTEEPTSNNTQTNKSSEEERLVANPITEEQTQVNSQTDKTSEKTQEVVNKYRASNDQIIEMNNAISKLTNTIPIATNVKNDPLKTGQISTVQMINDQQKNLILFEEKLDLLKIMDPTLEEILNKIKSDKIKILEIQKDILKSEIPLIADENVLSVYNNQNKFIDQLISDSPIISEYEKNKTKLNFELDASIDKIRIQQLAALPAYTSFLKQRMEYTEQQIILDSLEQLKIIKTQELLQMIQVDTIAHELNSSSMEKANSLSEILLQIEHVLNKQVTLENAIRSTENQASFEKMLQDQVSPIVPTNLESNFLPESFGWNANGTIIPMNSTAPLPILKNLPSGLFYRVQIGAYRKPISNDKFREFSPVSGEVIPNGLTCYLAGFFGEIAKAVNAKGQIRKLGYNDAFIVAYCDGKRISIAQARQYELNGLCKKNNENDLNIELAAIYNADKEIKESNETMPLNDDVYITVQVGVFAKTIKEEQLPGISELTYTKAPNGLLRYASGKFINLEDAKERKKLAINKGVKDAFIVAYRNGNRITVKEAQNYLAQKAVINTKEQIATSVTIDFSVFDILPPPKIEWVQFRQDIIRENAAKQLGIVNRVGTFVYNNKEEILISGKINRDDISPFEQIYLAQMHLNLVPETNKNLTWKTESLSLTAQIHDWLLQCSIPYSIIKSNNTLQIQFSVVEDSELEFLIKAAEKFNFNYF